MRVCEHDLTPFRRPAGWSEGALECLEKNVDEMVAMNGGGG